MAAASYSELVRREFGYLVDEFGFTVAERPYGPEPFDDSIIEYWSDRAVVTVQLDRFDVIVRLGPATEPPVARVSIYTAVAYFTPGQVTRIIDETGWPRGYEVRIEKLVEAYSAALRRYCEPALKESFSQWLALSRLALKQMQSHYKQVTGKELPELDLTAFVRSRRR